VDVNQGWHDKQMVLDMIFWMKEKNVILIEQPMPVAMADEMAWVTEQSPIVTIADESIKRLKDVENLKGSFSGINIKLMKSTGLTEVIEMARYAKQNNLKVLLGCMAESSCATSAMAQLMQLADYIDLDAPNLLKNDPFKGVTYKNGNVYLNDLPGIGVEPIDSLINF
jgi:L-alanine-DL-glutamate epimerase-like enolase superfamily enzyme